MKVDPCMACQSLNFRKDTDPAPAACPRCGGALLKADPRTGRASHVDEARTLIAEWEGRS